MARLKVLKPALKTLPPRLGAAPGDTASQSRYRDDTQPHRRNYKTYRWQRFREGILARDCWQCQMCGVLLRKGRAAGRSATVDHLMPVALRPDLFFDESNCRSVCRDCHETVCSAIEARHAGDAEAIRQAKLEWEPGGASGLAKADRS